MLSRPEHGWTQVTIGNFCDRASYLTDIPVKCLKAFIYACENNCPAVIKFDAEGWEYIVIVDDYTSHIISDNYDTDYTYKSVKTKKIDIANELVSDIEAHLHAWIMWNCGVLMKHDDYINRKNELQVLLSELKQFLI